MGNSKKDTPCLELVDDGRIINFIGDELCEERDQALAEAVEKLAEGRYAGHSAANFKGTCWLVGLVGRKRRRCPDNAMPGHEDTGGHDGDHVEMTELSPCSDRCQDMATDLLRSTPKNKR